MLFISLKLPIKWNLGVYRDTDENVHKIDFCIDHYHYIYFLRNGRICLESGTVGRHAYLEEHFQSVKVTTATFDFYTHSWLRLQNFYFLNEVWKSKKWQEVAYGRRVFTSGRI